MVDASIREPQIPAEVEKREKIWTERWFRNEQRGMNNDPSAVGRDRALALVSLTADILDIAGSSFTDF